MLKERRKEELTFLYRLLIFDRLLLGVSTFGKDHLSIPGELLIRLPI